MRVLSATDAIQPAWDHTRRMVFAPRRFGLALKLTAVAFLARLGGFNSSSFRNGGNSVHSLPPKLAALMTGAMLLIALAFLLIGLVVFYLASRMQFVLFDSVLRSDTEIAPMWRRFGRATWYWIGLKLAYFAVALLCCVPFLLPAILAFVRTVHGGGAQHNPAGFFGALFGFLAGIFLALLIIGIGYLLLSDFGLPSMALEGTSLGETVRRVVGLVRAEPGQVLLYMVLRFVFGIAASIGAVFVLVMAMLVAAVPLGIVGGIAWAVLHHGATMAHVFLYALIVCLGVVFAAFAMVASIMLFGYVQMFFQAYAVYFLAGRYALMGQMLESSVPPQVAAWLQPYPMVMPVPPPAAL